MSEDLSRAIVESSRFMRSVFGQVSALVQTLERDLQTRGWTSMVSSDIGAGLSNRLKNPHAWMPRLVSRIFAPVAGPQDRAIIFVVVLEADQVEGALLVTAALRLRAPVSPDELFSAWKTSDSLEDVLPLLSAQPETWMDLPESARKDPALWSDPKVARIRATDLAAVADEQALVRQIIEPAIAQATRLA